MTDNGGSQTPTNPSNPSNPSNPTDPTNPVVPEPTLPTEQSDYYVTGLDGDEYTIYTLAEDGSRK